MAGDSDQKEAFFSSALSPMLANFRKAAYDRLLKHLNLEEAARMPAEQLRIEVERFITSFSQDTKAYLNYREQKQIANEIVNDMIGLGPIEELLPDPTITDILINAYDQIYVERFGKLEKTPVHFRDATHLLQIAQRIANRIGRRIDESSPLVDARLADGSRVNIIIPPIALNGVAISIRRFSKSSIGLDRMVQQGNISENMARFLGLSSACRLNIIISGGTGSGKTTLLNALSQTIDPQERIVTLEDSAELKLQQPHVVRLESRPPNIEGKGELSIRDLVKNALRMRPDRIIIGECRGAETFDMLQAMNTGHDGSMSTVHANTAREALSRLENMVLMSGNNLPNTVIRSYIADAIDLVIQIARMRDGMRRVKQITEVAHMEGNQIVSRDLFVFKYLGEDEKGKIRGKFECVNNQPSFMHKIEMFNLDKEIKETLQ